MKGALQKTAVPPPGVSFFDLVNPPHCPRVNRRIHIGEVPFVSGKLPVGMHVPFAQQQKKLFLGKVRIDQRQRDAMKREIPGRVPRVFPLVRHGNHVGIVQVSPAAVASALPLARRFRSCRIAAQPAPDVVVVELLAPEQAGESLALDQSLVRRKRLGSDRLVELVSLAAALQKQLIESSAECDRDQD